MARTRKDLAGEEKALSKLCKLKQKDHGRNGIIKTNTQQTLKQINDPLIKTGTQQQLKE